MEYKFYNMDCVQKMREMIAANQKVDLIFTDPPYEIQTKGAGAFRKNRAMGRGELDFICKGFDYETCFDLFLKIQNQINILIFCSNDQISKTMQWFEVRGFKATLLIWKKTNPPPYANNAYLSDIEFIVWARDLGAYWNNEIPFEQKSKVYVSGITPNTDRLHPAQKRIDLLESFLYKHSREGDLIFDPFAGSASVGVACMLNGRKYIGCEIDKDFFLIGQDRLDKTIAEAKNRLF